MMRKILYLSLVMLSAGANGEEKEDILLVCDNLRQEAQARLLNEAEKKKFKKCESKPVQVEEGNDSNQKNDTLKGTGNKKDV